MSKKSTYQEGDLIFVTIGVLDGIQTIYKVHIPAKEAPIQIIIKNKRGMEYYFAEHQIRMATYEETSKYKLKILFKTKTSTKRKRDK